MNTSGHTRRVAAVDHNGRGSLRMGPLFTRCFPLDHLPEAVEVWIGSRHASVRRIVKRCG